MRDTENKAAASGRLIAITVNASWNVVNFRRGLIAGLQHAGYRVAVLSPPDEFASQLAALGVEHVPIAMDQSSIAPAADVKLGWDYVSALRRLRPAALLAFTPKPNGFGSLAAHALGIPVINNMTGMAFVERKGLARTLPMALLRLAFRRSRIVFFQNADDRDLFIAERIAKPEQSRLVPGSGIDLARFAPAPMPPMQEGMRFLLVARLLREKGVIEFVEAARQLAAHEPRLRFQLLGFVGAANQSALGADDVARWVDEGVIEYLGHCDDVRPALADAHCIVLPSYREGLPRALLEGAAMARPLIATDVPGCRAVVEDGVNGYLCAVRDAASLAAAMARMAALPQRELQLMASASRRKVEEEYAEQVVIDRYLNALGELLPDA